MSQVQESVALSIVSSSSVHRGVKWLSDMGDYQPLKLESNSNNLFKNKTNDLDNNFPQLSNFKDLIASSILNAPSAVISAVYSGISNETLTWLWAAKL